MRVALERMVGKAIGYGHVVAEFKDADSKSDRVIEVPYVGTVHAEEVLACFVARSIRRFLPEANPVAVRLVALNGTWWEAPTWTNHWHPV